MFRFHLEMTARQLADRIHRSLGTKRDYFLAIRDGFGGRHVLAVQGGLVGLHAFRQTMPFGSMATEMDAV